MAANDIWITGIGLVSCAGEGRAAHLAALGSAAPPALDDTSFAPFPLHPGPALELDRQIPKKGDQRQMETWQRLGTYAAGARWRPGSGWVPMPRGWPLTMPARATWWPTWT
jgi:3-oxoacyl-[acyl-carrier-protein] synthase II